MMEPDFVPMDFQSTSPVISQGIEINAWGRPVGYHVYRQDPAGVSGLLNQSGLKRIEAARMLHLANRHRIRQLRGVSVFASVLGRLDDLKDYEESERIAAKVAASMAAYIKKGQPEMYESNSDGEQRTMKFRPGMVFDDLRPGEDIGTIDTNRPNPNLESFRSGQLKAVASGTGPTYSSIAKTYDGTYSAQRQELVEGWVAYATLQSELTARIVRPVYERFIAMALASGALRLPAGMKPDMIDDAIYIGPQMPWIDPAREADAWETLERNHYASGPEIIRKRGANPLDVLDQAQRWRDEKSARGLQDAAPAPQPKKP
jgi:lambda family phage portal protein